MVDEKFNDQKYFSGKVTESDWWWLCQSFSFFQVLHYTCNVISLKKKERDDFALVKLGQ